MNREYRHLEGIYVVSFLFAFWWIHVLIHFLIKNIIEGYIYFCMMDLEYDGVYRFFQLSEIKIAQKLSEFNLMRKLILEAYFFKVKFFLKFIVFFTIFLLTYFFILIQCRINSYYSNEIITVAFFVWVDLLTPKAPKNAIPDVSLKKQKLTKKRKSIWFFLELNVYVFLIVNFS